MDNKSAQLGDFKIRLRKFTIANDVDHHAK